MTAATSTAAAAPPRWRVMPALALGTLMATIDISAVNVALPTLSRTFRLPLTTVQWVVLAYVLTITGLLLTFGRLADRVGRRRVYGIGLAVFTVASALCAAAPGAPALFAARAVQGLGAAMMTANTSALLISNFPPGERGRALGAFGAVVGVGLAMGPPLGGLLVGHLSWRWIFLINVPIGVFAQWQLRSRVPADAVSEHPARLHLPSAAVWCGALVLLMLGLSRGPERNWAGSEVWVLLGGAAALLLVFLWFERRSDAPLLPLPLVFGPVGFATFLTLLGQLLSFSTQIHMPLYLEEVLGFNAARSGQWLTVLPLTALLFAPLAGRWSDRWGARRIAMVGMALTVPGLLLLSRVGVHPGQAHLLAGLALMGIGLGLFTVPNASALFGAARGSELGLASGLQSTMRNLGIAAGAAVTAAVVASRYAAHGGGRLAGNHEPVARAAFALATRDLYLLLAAVAALAVALIALQREGALRHGDARPAPG
jgi:EmrB/QacA subfamily drug resistance transporter